MKSGATLRRLRQQCFDDVARGTRDDRSSGCPFPGFVTTSDTPRTDSARRT